MALAPSRFAPKPRVRKFSWSYSKLKNFESCPKRHYHADIKKDFVDELGDNLIEGNQVHDAMAGAIGKNIPLPDRFAKFQPWVDRVTGTGNDGRIVAVEQKLAITEDFQPCEFFDDKAWFRGVVDVSIRMGPVAVLLDWKMGKVLDDSVQLALFAQLAFSHYPELQKVRTEFVWLKSGDLTTREDFARNEMAELWAAVLPRLEPVKQAFVTGEYPVTPNRLCRKYCPVTICAHHGESN